MTNQNGNDNGIDFKFDELPTMGQRLITCLDKNTIDKIIKNDHRRLRIQISINNVPVFFDTWVEAIQEIVDRTVKDEVEKLADIQARFCERIMKIRELSYEMSKEMDYIEGSES